jgi:tetratricopeptide (TPR) repeat protein
LARAGPAAPDDLRLIQFAPDAQAATLPEQRRLLEIVETVSHCAEEAEQASADEIVALCDRLAGAGQLDQAVELLQQLSSKLPRQPRLRLRLAELLYQSRNVQPAIALLEELADEKDCRLRAHFLLGDHYGREAELERALQHYEAVLALDVTTPRALQRARDIRSRLDRPLGTSAPTLCGGDERGPSSRFALRRELGRGGSGTVYLALDRQLDRRVAVKALHRRVRARPDARSRLYCEARIAAALQDPGIVTIYDLDEQLDLVVMEYCAGMTLAEQLGQGPLPAPLALRRLAEVCNVLDRVHRCGIVHRDLKPANLVSRQAAGPGLAPLVITDFGIAHADPVSEAEPAMVEGSLVYMSPEQQSGAPPDPRSDLYSCGVILLEMLLGRPPLQAARALAGPSLLELEEPWRELEAMVAGPLHPRLAKLLRSLLSAEPDRRPAEAAAVARTALDLCRLEARWQESQIVAEELERRAGPPPHRPEVAEWLRARLALLGSGPELARRRGSS